jgi:hypothetical protein
MRTAAGRWYVLIHQLPPKPIYLRAKIRQRLARVGAVALKNSVYVLPRTDACLEDFQWIVEEAVSGGGEAHVFEGDFVGQGLDEQIVSRFQSDRNADFERLMAEMRSVLVRLRRRQGGLPADEEAASSFRRFQKRITEIAEIDFFASPNRKKAQERLDEIKDRMSKASPPLGRRRGGSEDLVERSWVTRKGIHIDRIASAWLVRRFIDPNAKFRFVDPGKEAPREGEVGFDMVGGDFTHEGDRCTFETLIARLGMKDAALSAVAEIVHDIDLKDGKFGRLEARGIEQLLLGIVLSHEDDESRLERGLVFFDDLYQSFKQRREIHPKKKTNKGGKA